MNTEENTPILMRFLYKRYPAGSEYRVALYPPPSTAWADVPGPAVSRQIYAVYRHTGKYIFLGMSGGVKEYEYEYQGIEVSG